LELEWVFGSDIRYRIDFVLYNEEIRNVYSTPNIRVIQGRKGRLAGHAARIGDKKFLQAFGSETGTKGTTWKT
jgi:hypothetical protein